MKSTYIIGEIGQNHNGSVDIAKLIVDLVSRPVREEVFNLEKRYGALPAGRYRIIKEFSIGSGDTRQAFLLAAEFDMEERRK